jgi:hypothetical protein
MIYHLSLKTAGILSGVFLLLVSLPNLLFPALGRTWLTQLPRSRVAGVTLLTIGFLWFMWLITSMDMGEFATFRKALQIFVPILFFLTLLFVREFLAVRAIGILFLLAAEPLLEAAFLRYELSRLLVTVFAYILVVAGLFYVTMPYVMRDQINWGTRTDTRWLSLNAAMLVYGAALLTFAFLRY